MALLLVDEGFGERFADPVNDFREVLFATGTKP